MPKVSSGYVSDSENLAEGKTLGNDMGLEIHIPLPMDWDETPDFSFQEGYSAPIKSIGNSTTTPSSIRENDLDAQIIFMPLAESASARAQEAWISHVTL